MWKLLTLVLAAGQARSKTDCVMSKWMLTGCSVTCGKGQRWRHRRVVTKAANGGKACGPTVMVQSCLALGAGCPRDCAVSRWGAWGECPLTCHPSQDMLVIVGTILRRRSRKVLRTPLHGGKACGVLTQDKRCNNFECPVDCNVSPWSSWSKCSASCGRGKRQRKRVVAAAAANGGTACPQVLAEFTKCQVFKPCPIDCQLTEWSPWGGCSKTCGLALKHRTRTMAMPSLHGGRPCSNMTKSQSGYCMSSECPEDLEVVSPTSASAPSTAAVSLLGQHTSPRYTHKSESGMCGTTEWGAWGPCRARCDDQGVQTRTRAIQDHCKCHVRSAHGSGWRRLFTARLQGLVFGKGAGTNHCPSLLQSRNCRGKRCLAPISKTKLQDMQRRAHLRRVRSQQRREKQRQEQLVQLQQRVHQVQQQRLQQQKRLQQQEQLQQQSANFDLLGTMIPLMIGMFVATFYAHACQSSAKPDHDSGAEGLARSENNLEEKGLLLQGSTSSQHQVSPKLKRASPDKATAECQTTPTLQRMTQGESLVTQGRYDEMEEMLQAWASPDQSHHDDDDGGGPQ